VDIVKILLISNVCTVVAINTLLVTMCRSAQSFGKRHERKKENNLGEGTLSGSCRHDSWWYYESRNFFPPVRKVRSMHGLQIERIALNILLAHITQCE
jgi:hypothetical protein